jgi:hypothetical protein
MVQYTNPIRTLSLSHDRPGFSCLLWTRNRSPWLGHRSIKHWHGIEPTFSNHLAPDSQKIEIDSLPLIDLKQGRCRFFHTFRKRDMMVKSPNLTCTYNPIEACMARIVLHEQIPYVWRAYTVICIRDAMFTEKAPHIKRYRYRIYVDRYTWAGYGFRRT